MQVAWLRMRLEVVRRKYKRAPGRRTADDEPVQNPSDPYRGWDNYYLLDHFHGPRTPEEEWVLSVLRALLGPVASQARSSSWLSNGGETVYQMAQAQIISHTVRMANAPRNRRRNVSGSFRIGLPGQDSDDSGPSDESSNSDFSDESDPSEHFLSFLNNGPGWRETEPGVYENSESAPQGAPPLRITQVPRDPPDVNEYGRQFSADEAGDGPGCWEPFRAWAILVRHRRSLTTNQEVQTDRDEDRLLVGRAEVRPSCDVCNTPCYVYRWCRFCRQENVMHHGRCCWYNPGWREQREYYPGWMD